MVDRSPADVSMTDAHEEDVSMADTFDFIITSVIYVEAEKISSLITHK